MNIVRVFHAAILLLASLFSGTAGAALVGVVQSYPDITLSQNFIVYDHNGVNANTGLLRIISMASVLNKASGGATQTQSYLGSGDSTADLMLSVQVNNQTGAFGNGSVSIGFGNSTSAPRFSWAGAITEFGFLDNGTKFDARWTLNSDAYQNMPASFSDYFNGMLSGRTGGIKIDSSAGFGAGAWATMLGRDWVYGSSVQTSTAQVTPFLTGLDAIGNPSGRVQVNSTIQADVFVVPVAVPVPAALWLMISGIGVLFPLARRNGRENASKPSRSHHAMKEAI